MEDKKHEIKVLSDEEAAEYSGGYLFHKIGQILTRPTC